MKGAETVNWTKDRSILLSQICTALFALLLAALDIGCYWAVSWFIHLRNMNWQKGTGFMVTIYLCSVFAWLLLYGLWKLLGNMKSGRVFVEENVKRLRMVGWCCVGAALICLASCVYYLPFLFVSAAAAFMALIVRIVKNVFQQANAMKSELDFTV